MNSSIDKHLSSFHFLGMVNSAAVIMGLYFLGILIWFTLGKYSEVGHLYYRFIDIHVIDLLLSVWWTRVLSFTVTVLIYIPIVVCFFENSPSDTWNDICLWFWFAFFSQPMLWSIFHYFFPGHLTFLLRNLYSGHFLILKIGLLVWSLKFLMLAYTHEMDSLGVLFPLCCFLFAVSLMSSFLAWNSPMCPFLLCCLCFWGALS